MTFGDDASYVPVEQEGGEAVSHAELLSDATRRVFASKHECSPKASRLGRELIAALEQADRQLAEAEKFRAIDERRASIYQAKLAVATDALEKIAKGYDAASVGRDIARAALATIRRVQK